MYEAPKARLDDTPVARGSVWLGLLAGWAAIALGIGLFVAWFVGVAFAVEQLGPSVLVLTWIGLVWLPAPIVALGIWLLRAGRSRTALGLLVAVGTGLVAFVAFALFAAANLPRDY
jgi:hypothetical protein